MKKFEIIFSILIILLLIGLSGYLLFQLSKSRTFQFFGGLTSKIDTNEKVVALTFDDAPSTNADEVLNILAEKDVKATFYVIGEYAEKYPGQIKKIAERGHELGNHSYSHQRFLFKSQSFIKNEVEKTNQLIRSAGYGGEITFRPPNGKKLFGLPWYLSRNNIKTITWSVEPDTYYPENAESIAKYTLDNVRPGSIILLHPFCDVECSADREALPRIIEGLKVKGYQLATVTQLLSLASF